MFALVASIQEQLFVIDNSSSLKRQRAFNPLNTIIWATNNPKVVDLGKGEEKKKKKRKKKERELKNKRNKKKPNENERKKKEGKKKGKMKKKRALNKLRLEAQNTKFTTHNPPSNPPFQKLLLILEIELS